MKVRRKRIIVVMCLECGSEPREEIRHNRAVSRTKKHDRMTRFVDQCEWCTDLIINCVAFRKNYPVGPLSSLAAGRTNVSQLFVEWPNLFRSVCTNECLCDETVISGVTSLISLAICAGYQIRVVLHSSCGIGTNFNFAPAVLLLEVSPRIVEPLSDSDFLPYHLSILVYVSLNSGFRHLSKLGCSDNSFFTLKPLVNTAKHDGPIDRQIDRSCGNDRKWIGMWICRERSGFRTESYIHPALFKSSSLIPIRSQSVVQLSVHFRDSGHSWSNPILQSYNRWWSPYIRVLVGAC
jgi:hypothetical protein